MKNNKKVLISLFIILIILSTYAFLQKSYAIVTPEMDATGISLAGKKEGDTVDYTLNDLYSRYDIFCCQKGTMAFIDGEQILNVAGQTFDVTSTTESGTILIDATYYNNNYPSDLKAGSEFETVSNPKYVIEDRKTATPKEAYILAEMTENVLYGDRLTSIYNIVTEGGIKVPANIKDEDITKTFEAIDPNGVLMTVYSIEVRDDDGKIISATFYIKEDGLYYKVKLNSEISATAEYGILSYVQNAWWTTEAGNDGNSVTPNQLSTEAQAFEEYVLDAAKVDSTSKLEYVDKSYSFTDEDGTEHSGTVKAAKFEYKPEWNKDANLDGTENENDEVVVAWDADTQTYKVGPFSINYVKGQFQTGERTTTLFADITDAKITTNIGELIKVTDQTVTLEAGQYRFIYKDGVERANDSEFPNPDEVFYLEIAYVEGMTELTNFNFDFKYMNAGGEYHTMVGRGIKQTWKVINNTTYMTPCTDEECERGHYTFGSEQYHQSYYCVNDVQLKCTSSSSKELQMFAYGVNGARWYETTSLSTNDAYEIEKEGTVVLEKIVVDKDGNPIAVTEDTDFMFEVLVETFNEDGTMNTSARDVIVTVKKGQTSGRQVISTEKWKDGIQTPRYAIREFEDDNYDFVSMSTTNGTVTGNVVKGEYVDRATVTVTAYNTQKEKQGNLIIKKTVIGKNLEKETFYFNIYINGNLYINQAPVSAETEWKYEMPEYTWIGEAPTYKVVEVNKDGEEISERDGIKYYGTNLTGNLSETGLEPIEFVDVINESIEKKGTLKITKKLSDNNGNQIEGPAFNFKVNVEGYSEEIIAVKPGETISRTYSWTGNTPPNYTVTEEDSEGYEFVSIETSNGAVEEKTAKGSLIGDDKAEDNTVYVVANNKEEKQEEGKIKITKQIVDKDGNLVVAEEDTTFGFDLNITKDGKTETKKIDVTVKKGESTATSQEYTYTWNKNEVAPTYTVTETKINGQYKLLEMNNANGVLQEDIVVEVIAKNTKDITVNNKSGKIKITKQIVDKDGNLLIADKDTTFEFDLNITKESQTITEKINVTVKAGQSTATSQELTYYWKEGEVAPTYKVTETKINGNYELLEMNNSEGTLTENTTVEVIAKNKAEELKGTLKIVKKVLNEELSGKLFNVKIYKNGEYYKTVEISDTKPYEEEVVWNANETAPQFSVEEIDLPSNVELVGYINNPAILQDGVTIEPITVINKLNVQKGKIQISKELIDSKGNSIDGVPFKFKLSIEGHEDKIITIKSGETFRSDYYYWTSEKGPKYTVTELDDDNYKFVVVNSNHGEINGKSVSGNLENNTILSPIHYINETKKENEGSLKITKKLEAEDKIDLNEVKDKFEFQVKVYYEDSNKYFEYEGEKYNSLTISRTVNGQGTTVPINIKWYEGQAPKYNVKEVNLPNNWRFKEFTNSNSGTFTDEQEVEVICINEQVIERKYYFTMEMGGKVWNDTNYENGKPADVDPNGIIDETEEGLSNIKVSVFKVIKDKNSRIVDKYLAGEISDSYENILKEAVLYTDENGVWKINKISVPALTESDKAKGYTKENGYSGAYDVEFTYDGQTYEPTKFLQTSNGDASKYLNATLAQRDKYLKDSMVIDNETERNEFNNRFQTISGKDPMDDNGNTIGQANSADGSSNELYYSSVDKQASTDSSTKKVSTLDLYNEKEELYEIYKMNSRTSTGGLVYPFDSKTVLKNTDTAIKFGIKTISYYYHAAYPYLNSINFGLVERKHSDLAIEKDLEQAIVVVNEKALKYNYGEIANAQFEAYPDLLYKQIQVNDKDIEYRLNLYKSDYYYKASIYNGAEVGTVLDNFYKNLGYTGKEEVELDVYLKYKITVTNESDSYVLEAKQIADYYDSDMTLVTNDVSKYIANNNGKEINAVTTIANASYSYNPDGSKKAISWNSEGKITDSSGEEYNIISTNSLTGTKIASGESRSLYVTFKVNKAIDSTTGIENCIKLGSKYNIAEIDAYSTYYQDGRTAGKIEEDSAPGNINIEAHNDSTWYEDDTSASPVLIIGLYDVKREVNGIAWEDKESETIQYNQVVGNGIYDSGENVIPNMTTELYEKVTVDGKDYDFLWPTDSTTIPGLNGMTIEKLTGLDSTISTDSNGKYKFNGIAAGNYIVRFTYGDSNTIQYNGQDYKSTTYQAGFDNDGNNDGLIDNVWHDLSNESLANTRVSDARDNEARRLDVIRKSQTLTYDNTSVMAGAKAGLEDYYMSADTAKINMNVEKNTTGTETVGGITVNTQKGIIDTTIGAVGATNITYLVENIDFGLERRSPTNVVIDKQIEEIKLITSTGQVILDAIYDITYNGDVATVVLNTTNSVGTENLQALNNTTVLQGFRYINVDEDILQGATIEIRYRFTALNSGEVDRCAEILKTITDFDSVIASEAQDTNFGNYLGKVYYSGKYAMDASGKCDDAIVETTVHKLVDYVDNDVVFSSMVNTGKDGSWTNTTSQELKDRALIDSSIIDSVENKILDEDARAYESENKNNLIMSVDNNDASQEQLTNPGFIKKLIPFNAKSNGATGEYASSMTLTVSRYYSSQSESENIDNLVEIIEMYNDVGRRDEDTIQGNAKPSLGAFEAASENDSSATEVITLTPPTGLSSKVIFMIQVLSVVLSGIAIMTVGIIAIKKKVLTK